MKQIMEHGFFKEWSLFSPDLAEMDFFLWVYMYVIPPPPLQDIQWRIMDDFTNVFLAMLQRVQREVVTRIQLVYCSWLREFWALKVKESWVAIFFQRSVIVVEIKNKQRRVLNILFSAFMPARCLLNRWCFTAFNSFLYFVQYSR